MTVYQTGWRLGGKGASGRGDADRIEEHGLHLWMGFYENAFRLMRECYAERHRAFPACRHAHWRDAFSPSPNVAVADSTGLGWQYWLAYFPPCGGEPGETTQNPAFTVTDYLQRTVVLLAELLRSIVDAETGSKTGPDCRAQDTRAGSPFDPAVIMGSLERLMLYGQLATATAIIEVSDLLQELVDCWMPGLLQTGSNVPLRVFDMLSSTARARLGQVIQSDNQVRRTWEVVDLVLAVIRGSIRCGLAFDPRGFDAINDHDWRDWLRSHGASEAALDSGFMRGIYDLTFAYEGGDVARPRLAAGVALRGAMRMFFTYRGALFWRMNGGMGDVVFAPLYQVLRERGVNFEFFHCLRNIGLSPDGSNEPLHVTELQFDVQATIKGGGEYAPLREVNGMPSWPAAPDYAQLENGHAMAQEEPDFEAQWETTRSASKTLKVTEDFDVVVLGVGLGAIPAVAGELVNRSARWREMATNLQTVATQSMQLWLRDDLRQLGWPHSSVNLSGFVEPFDTWADMSHLIAEENFQEPVRSIAYFCSVLPDLPGRDEEFSRSEQTEQHGRVRAAAVRFLKNDVSALWPRALDDRQDFRWSLLVPARDSAEGDATPDEKHFDSQYWRANVNPTDRYVLSLPGSHRYRISPLDMTVDNMTIVGDWTETGLDSGCIESAVISGLLASHAISGRPRLGEIIGYNHP